MAVPPAGAISDVVAAIRLAGGGVEIEGLVGQDCVFVIGHAVQVLAGDVFRVDADHEIIGVEQAHQRPQRLFQAEAMLLNGVAMIPVIVASSVPTHSLAQRMAFATSSDASSIERSSIRSQ